MSYRDPDTPPPPERMCDVCHYILTPHIEFDDVYTLGEEDPVAEMETLTWHHPFSLEFDHDPVPVPTDLTLAPEICDFCGSLGGVTGFALCTPFTVTYMGQAHLDNGSWACCAECQALIEASKGNQLVTRCVDLLVAKHGPDAEPVVRLMTEGFLKHSIGQITPVPRRHTPSS